MSDRLRRLRPDPVKFDQLLAVVLTAGLELETWLGGNAQGHRIALSIFGPVATGAIAIRRRHPAAVGATIGVLGTIMQAAWPSAELTFGIAWICDMYALAVWTTTRRFALALGLYLATVVVTVPLGSGSLKSNVKGATPFVVISTVVILIVRRVIGDRDRRAELAERERDVAAREAVVGERARIARELHDAIAHSVSMMVVQAGAERRVLEEGGGSPREVLETVEQMGRSALTEMRRLVGMLREDADDPLAPQPSLDDLPALVSQVREAGLPVELLIDGERQELPAGIALSAYRIVQEALTNALKHAGHAHAEVRVRYGQDSLELEILDDGAGGPTRAGSGGHGLVGMRERVALYGGSLDAGRRPSGGFAVRVLLPTR